MALIVWTEGEQTEQTMEMTVGRWKTEESKPTQSSGIDCPPKLDSRFSSDVLKLLNQYDGDEAVQMQPESSDVTVAAAAAKINASDLAAFLAQTTASCESHDIQLKRFARYLGCLFASISATQFPWMKILKESSLGNMVDIPVSHLSKAVHKTSVEWLSHISSEALGSFVLRSLAKILAVKQSKEVVQQPPKSRVAIFMVLAMVLRQKPDVLISLLPAMKEDPKYQGQEKLPLIIWLIVQACQQNLIVGLFMWVHLLLPMLSSSNPKSRYLILKLVERILSAPKARSIILKGVVWKGKRVVPPCSLELLMRVTFPKHSARVEDTKRFKAVYPTLKEIALAGSPGSKAMKQITQQILQFAIKAIGEGIPDLSEEASNIFIWCLTQNVNCFKQWDHLYLDNIGASGFVLRKLNDEWKELPVKHSSIRSLKTTLKSFSQKNNKALAIREDHQACASFGDAQKYCKLISRKLSWGCGCRKSMALVYVALAAGVAVVYQNIHLLQ